MSIYKRKSNIVLNIISIIISTLLIAGIAAIIYYNFSEIKDAYDDYTSTTFYIKHKGIKYENSNDTEVILLNTEDTLKFYIIGVENCTITVTPNVTEEKDFFYSVGYDIFALSQRDFTDVFISEDSVQNGCLTLDCSKLKSLESILSQKHNNINVNQIKVIDGTNIPFLLTFSNEKTSISFQLGYEVHVSLSDTAIVF